MFKLFKNISFQAYKNVNPVLSNLQVCKSKQNKLFTAGIQSYDKKHASTRDVLAPAPADVDTLLQTIRSATRVDHVLEAVGKHHSVMNGRQAISALRSLFVLQKSDCSSLNKQDVLHSKDFENLCKQIQKQSRTMDVATLLESLKVLTYFETPATSAMVQTILNLIKHQINDLSLQQIVFLHFLCIKFKSNPVGEALKIALPMVFESQLKMKMDKENLAHLAQLLQYAALYRVSESCVEDLVQSVSAHKESLEGREALQVAVAICSLRNDGPTYIALAHKALNGVDVNDLSYDEMSFLLGKVVNKCSRNRLFCNENFFDNCASHIIKRNMTFHEAVWTLRRLSKVAHTNLPLLDYIATKIEAQPQILDKCQPTYILALPAGFANADYKPKNWDQIKDLVLGSYKNLSQERTDLPWIKFALDFASLGCFDDNLLQHIFSESFLKKFLSREYNMLDYLQLLTLYQSVKALHPQYKGSFPPEHVIEKAKQINGENVKEFPLKSALENGLGGELYVQTRAYTQMGHFIDHAVALRRGGYPVALNQHLSSPSSTNRVYIENLKIPQDSQMVLVLAMPPGSYSMNGKRLRGSVSLRTKTLEASGYAVVTLSTEDWKLLPDFEKIPFLMQAIKLKSNHQYQD